MIKGCYRRQLHTLDEQHEHDKRIYAQERKVKDWVKDHPEEVNQIVAKVGGIYEGVKLH